MNAPLTPPVSDAQLSACPCPSAVMTPMPVTTMTGRPRWSVSWVMRTSSGCRHDGERLAAPVTPGGHQHLAQRRIHRRFRLL